MPLSRLIFKAVTRKFFDLKDVHFWWPYDYADQLWVRLLARSFLLAF